MGLLIFGQLQTGATGEVVFWMYGLKIILCALILYFCFKDHLGELEGPFDLKAFGLGILVFFIWIFLCNNTEADIAYDGESFTSTLSGIISLFFRILGACLIIPIIEELFFRSFLMRYLIKEKFLEISVGTYKHFSFWFTAIIFTLLHRSWEWPAAFIAAIAYGIYLVRTKNILGCIIAHGTTNGLLFIYILATKKWYLW